MRSINSQHASDRPSMATPHVSEAEPLEHPSAAGLPVPLEEALLHFDVEEDLAAIIPMPRTIPPSVRMAITKAACERFMFADELDDWLHAPDEGLSDRTPFETIVAGEGEIVLATLIGDRAASHVDRRIVLLPAGEAGGGGGPSAAAA